MPFNRHSKVRLVWHHPVGHDLLCVMLRQIGKPIKWMESAVVQAMPLYRLDRFAGAGFADMVIEVISREPQRATLCSDMHAWWKEAVVYQIYLRSFMDADHDGRGDIAGVIQRLPYLERLGVDILWLWTVLERGRKAGDDNGISHYRQVDPEYGDNEDLQRLLEEAHCRGMRVIIGMDITATSDEHPWFRQALAGENQDYFFFRQGRPDTPPNNWMRTSGGSMWTWYPEASAWALHIGGTHRMDLNWDNPKVRSEAADVLRFWLEEGVDGFCFGQVGLISKTSFEDGNPAASGVLGMCGFEQFAFGPRLHRYLRELRTEAGADDALIIGESRSVGTGMAKLFSGCERQELDMVMDSTHLAVRQRGRADEGVMRIADLKEYYLRWMEHYGGECWMSLFMETPETPRIVSRFDANPIYRPTLAKLLGTMLFTLRGTPMLYQGQELGIPNSRFKAVDELQDPLALRYYAEQKEKVGHDAALQKTLSYAADHARTPMPWTSGAKGGFTGAEPWMRLPDGTAHLNATAQMEDPHSVWHHFQALIALRKKHPCLVYGSFKAVFSHSKKTFCYFRIWDNHKWYVEMNLTEREVPRPGRISSAHTLMLSNYDTPAPRLRPYEANLYHCD